MTIATALGLGAALFVGWKLAHFLLWVLVILAFIAGGVYLYRKNH